MSERRAPPARRRGPRQAVQAAAWLALATVVAASEFARPRRPAALGPAHGRLAAGLPALPEAAPPAPIPPPIPRPAAPPPPPAAPTPAPAPTPRPAAPTPPALASRSLRILAEVESVFAAERARGARGARDLDRELPRPFAALRRTASPLIMPRLGLPRVLTHDFVALRGLAARARPGQAVHVRLTAYCLIGRTRQGTVTRAGIIAADPSLFPLARSVHLFAAGRYLGRFRVEDTGGAVRGPHIDIWTPDCADARAFGSRPGVASLARFGED